MKLIPAMDILDGKIVRLTKGDFKRSTFYDLDPVEWTQDLEQHGLQCLHLVDLEGARSGQTSIQPLLEKLAGATNLTIDVGGGIRDIDTVKELLDAGAAKVNLGSIAIKKPEVVKSWITELGADKIILGLDLRHEEVATHGWLKNSGLHYKEVISFFSDAGLVEIVCTDISRDGALSGPAIDLYKKIKKDFPDISLIASGGVSSVDDLKVLREIPVEGVIIGKALYEEKITLKDLKSF